MKSIGEAIQYLHSINIAHRDVKVPPALSPPLALLSPPWLCQGQAAPALLLTPHPLPVPSRKISCTPPRGPTLC